MSKKAKKGLDFVECSGYIIHTLVSLPPLERPSGEEE
jgi:hypothetical protein